MRKYRVPTSLGLFGNPASVSICYIAYIYNVRPKGYAEIEIRALAFGVPDQLTLNSREQSTRVS